MTPPNPIVCPSCYRRHGGTVIIEVFPCTYLTPNGGEGTLWVYQCTDIECKYITTEHEFLYHAFRAHYHRLLDIVLNIRGWLNSPYNSDWGKFFVINRAVETYFEKNQK